jgi:hypothetical protein
VGVVASFPTLVDAKTFDSNYLPLIRPAEDIGKAPERVRVSTLPNVDPAHEERVRELVTFRRDVDQ